MNITIQLTAWLSRTSMIAGAFKALVIILLCSDSLNAQTWGGSFGATPTLFNLGLSTSSYVTNPYSGSIGFSTGGSTPVFYTGTGTYYYIFFPTVTTTYTYAPAPPYVGGASATVVVHQPPLIYEFTSSSYNTTPASSCATLRYRIANAVDATISSTDGYWHVNTAEGEWTWNVCPGVTTTYTLTVTGTSGETTSSVVTINRVNPPPPTPPAIYSFYASQYSIAVPDYTTLTWSVANNASSVYINGQSLATSGSWQVNPSVTTTYTLTVTAPGGTASSQLTINVIPPPTINSFATNASSVVSGFPALLSWNIGDATSVSINNGVGSVATSGSRMVYPTATTTYTILASGPGGTRTSQVTVSVISELDVPATTVNGGETRRFEATASLRTGSNDNSRPFTAKANSNVFLAAIGGVVLKPGTRLETGTSTRVFSYYNSFSTGGVIYGTNTAGTNITATAAKNEANKLEKVSSDVKNNTLPTEYGLEQNTPNPFNPTTVIRYALKAPSKVSLRVYDLLGREVIKLVDENKAAGRYEARFDGTRLASGMYLYRLETGDFVQTKKMMLVK